jgi:hypothetical protein
MISTEHSACLATASEVLPSKKRTVLPWPCDELGGYTSAVIEHISGQQKHSADEYKDYLEANADYSADLAAMIADFVDYGKTKQRFERLTARLEVPSAK